MSNSQGQQEIEIEEPETKNLNCMQPEHPPVAAPPFQGGHPTRGIEQKHVHHSGGSSTEGRHDAPQHPLRENPQTSNYPPVLHAQASGHQIHAHPVQGHPQGPSQPTERQPQAQSHPPEMHPHTKSYPPQMYYQPPGQPPQGQCQFPGRMPQNCAQTYAYLRLPPPMHPPQSSPETPAYPYEGNPDPQGYPPPIDMFNAPPPPKSRKGEACCYGLCCGACCGACLIICLFAG